MGQREFLGKTALVILGNERLLRVVTPVIKCQLQTPGVGL